MNPTCPTADWFDQNQKYLVATLKRVSGQLERHAADSGEAAGEQPDEQAGQAIQALREAMPTPPALDQVCSTFGLSPFERDVLVLCAGVELDSRFARLCAEVQGDPSRTLPTFSLALAVLPDAHWSALTPAAPLRYWRLIETGPGTGLTQAPLRIDERILHYLTGVQHQDERLAGFVEAVQPVTDLVPSHQILAERLKRAWTHTENNPRLPAAQLCGRQAASLRAIASAICSDLGLNLYAIPAEALPLETRELEAWLRLWNREAALSASALLLECGDLDANNAAVESAITRLIENAGGALFVAGRGRRAVAHRFMVSVDVPPATQTEQRSLWQQALGTAGASLDGQLDALVAQFRLDQRGIQAACAEALENTDQPEQAASDRLWDACRLLSRPRLEGLARRIEPVATWADLVLSKAQLDTLRQVAAHVRQRARVHEAWGFRAKSGRGLGISALFSGSSGTGKTMAAEVLANDLRLDLYRIDLSQVVSKYIGETEKNLQRVFDTAEQGGAILLFDEADALFGKRSEVRDSHDRYANVEISYLLQRMEDYDGLAILTTNMKEALDPAFMRRIRFVVQFQFPDIEQRIEIWRRIFPASTPIDGINLGDLARLNVSGGTIRNIALQAAFAAADAGEPVRMAHLLHAARIEYAKLEKPLTDSEIRGWA
jgi:hypothetical protein